MFRFRLLEQVRIIAGLLNFCQRGSDYAAN